ncbi:MAG: FAD-dependent oxidoreductase [Pseudomonadota bacterium]
MPASQYEQDLATAKGVAIRDHHQPVRIDGNGAVTSMTLAYTQTVNSGLENTGETVPLEADQVLKAIGQTLDCPLDLGIDGKKVAVDAEGRTSVSGDCASGGDDLTVTAVAEGRDAAESIHRFLTED